jgi:hypothetical protein
MTYYVSHYCTDEDMGVNLSFKDFDDLTQYIEFFFIGCGQHSEYSLSISMVQDDE